MAYSFKKITAAAVAALCVASMAGCSDNGYIGTVDNMEIRNGIYLWCMNSAYDECYTEVMDVKEEAGDTSEVADLMTQTVDGKPANDWIKENALVELRRHVAVNRLFEEKGLTLSAEANAEVNKVVNAIWDDESMYAQIYYGTATEGEHYESIGIGMETMRDIYTTNSKEKELIQALYSEGGEKAVSAEELNTFLTDTYANVKYIELPYKDMYGITLKLDEEIDAVVAKAQGYVDRLNGGESFIEIRYDFDLENAQNEAMADREAEFEASTFENPSDEEWDAAMEAAKAEATADKYETVEELEVAVKKDSSNLSEELTAFIWATAADGKAYLLETETAAYVVVREDITTKTEWIDKNKATIFSGMKGDDFEAYLAEVGAAYDVQLNDSLVNNKYSPAKYFKVEKE